MFDKNKPAGTQKVRLADDDIRANNAALETAIDEDHDFTTGGTQTGEHHQITLQDLGGAPANPVGNVRKIYNNGGFAFILTDAGVSYPFTTFPAGTKMYFYQDTAPVGWTIDGACADALLAVKGGADAYNVAGGNQAGIWTQPNHTHTGPNHTHTGPSHTHTGPSHTHTIPHHRHYLAWELYHSGKKTNIGYVLADNWPAADYFMTTDEQVDASYNTYKTKAKTNTDGGTGATSAGGTGATGAGGTGATGASGTGATGGAATAATYRPLAQIGIIASKD